MTKPDYTHIALIVDRSGSMEGIHTDMNPAILKLLKEQSEVDGDCTVDVTTFDDQIEFPYVFVDPLDVKDPVIVPRGSTALNDATGSTIVRLGEALAKMDEADRPSKVIVIVVTDGMENASREYTREQVKALVDKQTSEFQWEFVFLAANIDAFETGRGYGYTAGQTMNFAPSSAGVANSYAAASANITRSRVSKSKIADFTEGDREEAMQV